MTTVTLSTNFSGFTNVPDEWVIGLDETRAGTGPKTYALPEGYSIDSEGSLRADVVIRDPDGVECEILTHQPSGRPQLASTAQRDMPVLELA